MASRAFTMTFTMADCRPVGSTRARHNPDWQTVLNSMSAGITRDTQRSVVVAAAFTSTTSGASGALREKASMLLTSSAPRLTAPWMSRRMSSCSAGSKRRAWSSSTLPWITASRLLKSCAMPPVSLPTASSFCDWRRAAWASTFSVMSIEQRMDLA